MRTEHRHLGASFVTVMCGINEKNSGCNGALGSKWLFNKHKGYSGAGGEEVTQEELSAAEGLAKQHEQDNEGHQVRVVVGHLR